MTNQESGHNQTTVKETAPDEEMDVVGEEAVDELSQAIEQRDQYLDQLQRSRAEFINFRKRSEQERLKLGELITANTLSQFLPVIDDFDRAMSAVPDEDRDSDWLAGIAMIQKKLHGILERAGVQPIDALNQPFDPAIHESVSTEPGTSGDTVVEVYQKGYLLGNTLLRAAMVKTGDASPGMSEETEEFNA